VTDLETLRSYVDLAVSHAQSKDVEAIVYGQLTSGTQLRFSQNSIDIGKQWESQKLLLFLIVDKTKTGVGERSVTSEEDVKSAVDDTIAFTKLLPDAMLFHGVEEGTHKYAKIKDQYDERIDSFNENAPGIVNSAIDAAVSEGAKRVAGALKVNRELAFMKSSYGPAGDSKRTLYDLNIRAFQDELDYSGHGISCGTQPSKSEEDMIQAGATAGRFSKQANGALQGDPGKYDLILSPTVAGDLMGYTPMTANPFFIMMGLSPLGDKMGEQLAPEFVTVADDPTMPGGMESHAFDFEGTPSIKVPIIEKGVLKGLVHNTSTAQMYETESTGSSVLGDLGRGLRMLLPASSNLVFENGNHSFEELLEGSRPTIYMTVNWYTRWQNQLTGEFSTITRDATFLVKDGEFEPIKNLRVSDNILRMLSSITAMGNDRKQVYWWGSENLVPTYVPHVRIADCRMTAATQ
jgi:PmbA protein